MDLDVTIAGLKDALTDGKSPVDITFPPSRSQPARVDQLMKDARARLDFEDLLGQRVLRVHEPHAR